MSNKKQKDVIEDITEQSLLTLDGVAEEISEQAVNEEVDNFIADRSLKENQKEVIAIANKVKEYKKGDKTNFGVVTDVSASSITFKAKDTPKTKIVFNQRKMGSKDYVLSALRKLNESMDKETEMEDEENMENKVEESKKMKLTFTIPTPQPDDELQDVIDLEFADAFKDAFGDDKEIPVNVYFREIGENKYSAEWSSDMTEAESDEVETDQKEESESDEVETDQKEEEEMQDDMEEAKSEEDTIESIASKLELTDDQVETLLVKSNEKYGEEGESMLLDMLKMVAQVVDKKDDSDEEESDMEVDTTDMEVDTTDIEELVSSEEGLTEGFKEKASIIFEAAVASKVKETKSLLEEQYATRLDEEVEAVKENLVEKVDSYLTYAVETWVADNKVAVESTLRTEITESFIGSLKSLFTEHYIEVPESKVDLFANMETQVSELKEQVEKKGRIANALADRVEKLTREKVIAEASAGLADTQIAKLTEMVQDVEFINEATFSKKVATIREFYIDRRKDDKKTLNENVDDNTSFISKETIVEDTIEGEKLSPSMQNYLSAMSRMNKATTANLVV